MQYRRCFAKVSPAQMVSNPNPNLKLCQSVTTNGAHVADAHICICSTVPSHRYSPVTQNVHAGPELCGGCAWLSGAELCGGCAWLSGAELCGGCAWLSVAGAELCGGCAWLSVAAAELLIRDSQLDVKLTGTTLVAVLVAKDHLWAVSVGNSRAVLGVQVEGHWAPIELHVPVSTSTRHTTTRHLATCHPHKCHPPKCLHLLLFCCFYFAGSFSICLCLHCCVCLHLRLHLCLCLCLCFSPYLVHHRMMLIIGSAMQHTFDRRDEVRRVQRVSPLWPPERGSH